MVRSQGQAVRSLSPLTWDDNLPWWEALKPDWWAGSVGYVIRERMIVWIRSVYLELPECKPHIPEVADVLAATDILPVQVQQLETVLAHKVEQGQLPARVLEMLWESLTWGDPDWEIPEELTWRYFRENASAHLLKDLTGE